VFARAGGIVVRKWLRAVLVVGLVLGVTAQGAIVGEASAATFCDVPTSVPYYEAVTQLSSRGIIRGYDNGCFGPNDTTLRAQMAAMIARTMGWDAENHGNNFPNRGSVDADPWRNIGTLHVYGATRGYQDGTYQPTGIVLNAQVISFTCGPWWQSVTGRSCLMTLRCIPTFQCLPNIAPTSPPTLPTTASCRGSR
jgi:hypothetical protein